MRCRAYRNDVRCDAPAQLRYLKLEQAGLAVGLTLWLCEGCSEVVGAMVAAYRTLAERG